MNRNRLQRLVTTLAIVAGWAALVATSPPSSTVESEEFTGTVLLSRQRPEVRVPLDLEFTQNEDDVGGTGLTIDVVHSWAGVAASRLPLTIESPTGSVEIDSRYFVCRDCDGPGELVIQWPWWEEEGTVVVTWTASAALSFDTDTPPAGASVAFDMDVPPIEIEESRIYPVEALDTPIQRETLTVEGQPDPEDHLRIAWPGWYADPKVAPNAVLIRWGAQDGILAPGLAVEIPVAELCTPGCAAELTYFLDREPSAYLGPWEFIAPLTAAFVGGGTAQVTIENVPVPSVSSTPIATEATIPPSPEPNPDPEQLTLSIETDPIDDEIAPVARVSYTVTAADSVPWVDRDDIVTRVGEHSIVRLDGEKPQGEDRTSIPLRCDQSACRADVPVSFESELLEPATLHLDLVVEVFHPSITGRRVQATLSESS